MDKSVFISGYFQRIGLNPTPLEPTLANLKVLQTRHLLSIPFENLDRHWGKEMVLQTEQLYQKIVLDKRGGFCYELNGLFYSLLSTLGYDCQRISARVYNEEKGFGPEFDHLSILVSFDGETYLTDVGFGEFIFHPLKLDLGKIQEDPRGNFLLEEYDKSYYKISKMETGKRMTQFIFTTEPRDFSDFEEMCRFHHTSPLSHFAKKPMIGIPKEDGRVTLAEGKLVLTKDGIRKEIPIRSEEFENHLEQFFGIVMKGKRVTKPARTTAAKK